MQSNKQLFLFIGLFLLGVSVMYGQEDMIKPLPIKARQDSIKAPALPQTLVTDTVRTDSVRADSVPKKPSMLLDNIQYKAKD
ncbi:hypothetical protein, partial [uncultured Muriicola sp.]|uniref:hypothetical protein n=1 Tax=uncultured Muriicola sp. TaxID=1583102 RepID=UPI00261F4793